MKNGANGASTKNFFTVKEAAAFIGMSPTTFYKHIQKSAAKGGPPVRRFGKNFIRIPRKQFIAWAGIETET